MPGTITESAAAALRRARNIVVLTGAGVSAESGMPTFRGAQTGLWARYDPAQLATPEAFRRDPELVWRWYLWRRQLATAARPNPAHHAIVDLERLVSSLTLVTQNVDGLHQRAGSRDAIELHGNILRTRCADCGAASAEGEVDVDRALPRCSCGGLLRPDVVWFGEALPAAAFERAQQAARGCDLLLSVGTSSLVYPAAALPWEALTGGAVVIEVNPEPTPLTARAHHVLAGPAGEVLPALLAAAWEGQHEP